MIVPRRFRRGFRRGFPRSKRSGRGGIEKREVGGSKSKACVGCRTTETPLWRSGPDGPKTLCNACGIRYRKLRRKGNHHKNQSNSSGSIGFRRTPPLSQVEAEAMKQKQKRKQEGLWLLLQQSRKFASTCGKEEAEAAVLLMALSTGLFVHS